MTSHDSMRGSSASVTPLAALISILAFWLFYVAVVTARAALLDFPAQGELAMRRVVVSLVGILLTWIMYLVLRLFDEQRLPLRMLMAFLLSAPAALAIATINHVMFNVYDPVSILKDVPDAVLKHYRPSIALELAESSLQRFFFLVAWAALYLALSYAGRVRLIERQNARLAQAAQAAELRSLRYQVNPHFLFNTLNSLSSLVMARRGDEAETMILNLAHFYRASLTSDPLEDVPLTDEVELQRLYLQIEAVRFPDRLRWETDIPAECGPYCVPGLILQPLIENAIKHGVSRVSVPVTIRISARIDGHRLLIAVSDNAPEADVSIAGESNGTGIGLANVRDRIQARYGSDARVVSAPGANGGYTVEIDIPATRHGC